jgi:hypothetical protein
MAAAQPPGNPRTLSDEFAIRYYRWSLDDARRELRENFPLLRAVKSSLVIRAIAYLESLADRDRLCGATALVKRSHRRAVELAGDSWGAEDEAIDRDYRNAGRIPRPDEEWSRPARLDEADKLKLDRGQFLSAVKAEPTPVLGTGEPFSTKHEWRYATPLGPWTLETFIDVGATAHQLAYSHAIRAAAPRPLREGVSLCGWLGIGGGHTTWNQLTQVDAAAAAQSLARICAHFVQAVPTLVAGLAPG